MQHLTNGLELKPRDESERGLPFERDFMIVESPDELPVYEQFNELFIDFETTSGDKKRGGLLPYKGDRICGIAVSVDNDPEIYYIPIRHSGLHAKNIELAPAIAWLKDVLYRARSWVNQNPLFDAHFARQEGIEYEGELIDLLVLSKLHNSDRWNYDQEPLLKEWMNVDVAGETQLKNYLRDAKTKDWADAPVDILGLKACEDIWGGRLLYRHLMERSDTKAPIFSVERALTAVLFDMEREGLPVDVAELKREQRSVLQNLIRISYRLEELIGFELNPKSHVDICDLLVHQYGLPILMYKKVDKKELTSLQVEELIEQGEIENESDAATFDKHALKLYAMHPITLADPVKKEVLELITEYRKDSQYLGLFVTPYLEKQSAGLLHPSFNQCVRTGRMSCRNPNAQQLNKRAKALIHPKPGYAFLSCDYSQIEFRLIVHYIEDPEAIAAYQANPNTDFHQWVADLCGVKRKQAKNLNFAMGYGAGKTKVLSMLASDDTLIKSISEQIAKEINEGTFQLSDGVRRVLDTSGNVNQSISVNEEYKRRCEQNCLEIYATYHERLPGIKRMSKMAGLIAKRRGYVFTGAGRRRHLPDKFSFRAFNAVTQGFAADIMKERLVFISPRYNQFMRDHDIRICCCVHDEALFTGPAEELSKLEVQRYIVQTLQDTIFPIKVPIITSCGYSSKSWAEAGEEFPMFNEDGLYTHGAVPQLWNNDACTDICSQDKQYFLSHDLIDVEKHPQFVTERKLLAAKNS